MNKNPWAVYVLANYFIMSIVTTVGYGDIYSATATISLTNREYLFLCALEIGSAYMMALVMFSVLNFKKLDNSHESQMRKHLQNF